MLCPPPFGLRGDLVVKKLLAENYLGRPHHIRLQSFTSAYMNAEAPAHWRQRIEISGLNVLALGIYVEVLQRWLGDITGVYARGKIVHPMRQGYEVVIPDLLTVLCTFASGAEGVLEFSGVNALAAGDKLEVYGDAGSMTYDFGTETIRTGKVGDVDLHEVEIPPELEGEWQVEDDFIAAVKSRGRIRPRPDFDEGMRYMRVVQAVADSRASNKWVEIKH
jgi:predicted dehydrogenase